MKSIICLLILSLALVACGHTAIPDTDADASVEVDAAEGPTDEEIMASYVGDVVTYQEVAEMPAEWLDWMLDREHEWSKAYISPRRNSHDVRIYVRYESVPYIEPWTSEDEHFTALKTMAELQYPGWTFTFVPYYNGAEDDLLGNDAIAILGGHGTSYASGHTIYLVYETIFGHEYGHTLGLRHHYCNNNGGDHCPEAYPPGEGLCVMDRTSASFGPTENSFLLLTTGERKDDEISAAIREILRRYPPNFAAAAWDECGMEE